MLSTTNITRSEDGIKIEYTYFDDFVCLDTETSNNHAESADELITWMTSSQWLWNDEYYLDRYPEDLMGRFNDMIDRLSLNAYDRLVVFIHNSSYDLSYLIPYLHKYVTNYKDGTPITENTEATIILEANRFLIYTWGPFEIRCSYKLADMSLEKWSKECNVLHQKKIGLYDYSKIIYQDDELNENEKDYDKYDVMAMKECIEHLLKYLNDKSSGKTTITVATLPITATQFVRKELAAACNKDKKYKWKFFLGTKLDENQYKACVMAYSGGYTHCNRFWADKLVKAGETYDYRGKKIHVKKIGHRDFKSDYPTQMTCYQFPITKFYESYNWKSGQDITIDEILNANEYQGYATLTVMYLYSCKLKDESISMPFLQQAKIKDFSITNPDIYFKYDRVDNGRVLEGSGCGIVYVEDPQLRILNDQYKLEYTILTVYKSKYGYLPSPITDTVDAYFAGKSNRKHDKEEAKKNHGNESDEVKNAEFELSQVKKRLNSLYGCCATNPLRNQYVLGDDMDFLPQWKVDFSNMARIKSELDKYYDPKSNHFLPYQWGVWITANARWELYEFIQAVGYDYVLYADTDSLFYIVTDENEDRINKLNAHKKRNAHWVLLDNGQAEYYDEFGVEDYCLAFKGLHSKCYGVVTEDIYKGDELVNPSHLEITIAGVPRSKLIDMKNGKPVYYTREQELAGTPVNYYRMDEWKDMPLDKAIVASIGDPYRALDNLKDGFIFRYCSGTTGLYVGATGYGTIHEPTIVEINGHEVHTAGGCVIREVEEKQVKFNPLEAFEMDNGQNEF